MDMITLKDIKTIFSDSVANKLIATARLHVNVFGGNYDTVLHDLAVNYREAEDLAASENWN